jgi:hypothetical protein
MVSRRGCHDDATVPSPVFQRLGRVDQDGIGELSGEFSNVFDGGAHVVFLVSFLWESCTSSGCQAKIMRTNPNKQRLLRAKRSPQNFSGSCVTTENGETNSHVG